MIYLHSKLAFEAIEELEDKYINTVIRYIAENLDPYGITDAKEFVNCEENEMTFKKFLAINGVIIASREAAFLSTFELNTKLDVNDQILEYFGISREQLIKRLDFDPEFEKSMTISYNDLVKIPKLLGKQGRKRTKDLFKKLSEASFSYFKLVGVITKYKSLVEQFMNNAGADIISLHGFCRTDPRFNIVHMNEKINGIDSRDIVFYILNAVYIITTVYPKAFELYVQKAISKAVATFTYVYDGKDHVVKLSMTQSTCNRCLESSYIVIGSVFVDALTTSNELCNLVHSYAGVKPEFHSFISEFSPRNYGSIQLKAGVVFEKIKKLSLIYTCKKCMYYSHT